MKFALIALVYIAALLLLFFYPSTSPAWEYEVNIHDKKVVDEVCITISGDEFKTCTTCKVIPKDKFEEFKNSKKSKAELTELAIRAYKNQCNPKL